MQRILFRAHQYNILALHRAEKAIHGFTKIGRFAACRIIHQAVLPVIPGIQRTPAKLVSKKLVDDLRGGQLRHKRFPIELRKTETAGPAAHIADHMNFVADQGAEKV